MDGCVPVVPPDSVVRGLFSQEARRGLLCIMASRHPRPISPSLTVAGGLPQEVAQSQGNMALLVPPISLRSVQKFATSRKTGSACARIASAQAVLRGKDGILGSLVLPPSSLFPLPQAAM